MSRSRTTTPAGSPWAFAGGTITKAVIDVSGEPFVDFVDRVASEGRPDYVPPPSASR